MASYFALVMNAKCRLVTKHHQSEIVFGECPYVTSNVILSKQFHYLNPATQGNFYDIVALIYHVCNSVTTGFSALLTVKSITKLY